MKLGLASTFLLLSTNITQVITSSNYLVTGNKWRSRTLPTMQVLFRQNEGQMAAEINKKGAS